MREAHFGGAEADDYGAVVGGAAMQSVDGAADEASDEAAVEAERENVGGVMGVFAGPHVAETWQQRGADQIVIAEDGGAVGQGGGDAAELAAVEDLAVGEVDIGNGEGAEVDDLADAAEHGALLEVDDRGLG